MRTVPPSGTLTVVLTVVEAKVGNCTVVPEIVCCALAVVLVLSFGWAWTPAVELSVVVVVVPLKVNIYLGDVAEERDQGQPHETPVAETTAWTVRNIPSFNTTITGCDAATKSPT